MDTAATARRVSATTALLVGLTLAVATALTGASVARSAGNGISSIDVLSNRADLVSGGDALVAVRLAAGADPATVRVNLNGTDITSTFASGGHSVVCDGPAQAAEVVNLIDPEHYGFEITVEIRFEEVPAELLTSAIPKVGSKGDAGSQTDQSERITNV